MLANTHDTEIPHSDNPANRTSFSDSRKIQTGWYKRREALGSHKRLLYCVNVNRTSLDHLLLGEAADIDQLSNAPSIPPNKRGNRTSLTVSALSIAFRRHSSVHSGEWSCSLGWPLH
jgi:hypothetical protein